MLYYIRTLKKNMQTVSEGNLNKMQAFQNKVLRNMIDAPWDVWNNVLYRDLGIKTVQENE